MLCDGGAGGKRGKGLEHEGETEKEEEEEEEHDEETTAGCYVEGSWPGRG